MDHIECGQILVGSRLTLLRSSPIVVGKNLMLFGPSQILHRSQRMWSKAAWIKSDLTWIMLCSTWSKPDPGYRSNRSLFE